MTIYLENGKFNSYTYLIDTNMFSVEESAAVYLLDGGTEFALFDAGTSDTRGKILRTIRKWNIDLAKIKYIIPSHSHFDHAGGAPFLLRKLPNAEIYASRSAAEGIKDPTEHVKRVKKAFGVFVGKMEPVNEVNIIQEGDVLEVGELQVQVLETPGHTNGDISLNILKEGESETLLCGCAIGNHHLKTDYVIPNSWPPEFNHEKAMATIRRIEAMNPIYLGLAHFGVARGEDKKRVLKNAIDIQLKFKRIIEEEYPKTERVRPVVEKILGIYKDTEFYQNLPKNFRDLEDITVVSLVMGFLMSLGLR